VSLPNRKLDATFLALGLDGTTKEGTYSVIYTAESERYETHFGEYSAISIHLPDKIVQNGYTPPNGCRIATLVAIGELAENPAACREPLP
jgi:hypothetical protein